MAVAVDRVGSHGHDASGRLLLQPLACVPGIDARPSGELGWGRRAVGERLVEAETVAELDGQ